MLDVIQIILAVGIGLLTLWGTYFLLFSDDQQMADAADAWVKPGIRSLLDGNYIRDHMEGKIFTFWLICGLLGGLLGYGMLIGLRQKLGW